MHCSPLACLGLDGCLGRSQPGNGHPEVRTDAAQNNGVKTTVHYLRDRGNPSTGQELWAWQATGQIMGMRAGWRGVDSVKHAR